MEKCLIFFTFKESFMSRILVLTAHRTPDESRINQALIEAVRPLPNVTVHELIRAYPDYRIDVAREQALLESHDAVVMMFPFSGTARRRSCANGRTRY